MVAGGEHVGQGEHRREQRVVRLARHRDQGAVGERDAHRLALTAVGAVGAPAAAVPARGLQPLRAEVAGVVGPDERCDDELARIVEGPDAAGWDELDAALLRAADELLDDAMVGDATWAVLAGSLDTQQLMDVVFTVGAYDIVAMAFKSFGVEIDDDLKALRKP